MEKLKTDVDDIVTSAKEVKSIRGIELSDFSTTELKRELRRRKNA